MKQEYESADETKSDGILGNGVHKGPKLLLLRIFILVSVLCLSASAHAAPKKNVLILHSYHQGYKWTDDETQGAISGLGDWKERVNVCVEYMGTKWIVDDPYFKELSEIYKRKFSNVKFDVIVAADNDAFNFLRHYRDGVFGKIPTVFCGVNWFHAEDLRGQSLYTGVNEEEDIASTLDCMLKLHPQTKRIYIVNDSTTTGHKMQEEVQQIIPRYRDKVNFQLLEEMKMDEIIDIVAHVSDDSLILVTVMQKDASGNFFEFNESTRTLSRASRVPVYGIGDFNLGFGIVGGMLTSGRSQGSNAGALASRILNGESPDSIPVIQKSPNQWMFDYPPMLRFGIKRSDLPPGSIVINAPSSFYAVNRALVWGVVSGVAGLTLTIAVLLINIHRRMRAEEALQEAHDKLERRVEERTAQLETSVRELEQFCYSVSHDLRAPLRSMNGFSQIIMEDATKNLDEPTLINLRRVRAAAQKMGGLIDGLLSLSRISRREVKKEPVDLSQLARSIAEELKRCEPNRRVDFVIAEGATVHGDSDLLRSALFNLLANAWKFTNKHERARIEFGMLKEDKRTVYFVRDDGAGFDMAYENKLFGVFQRLHSVEDYRGDGIGLATVQRVVQRHGGKIWAEGKVEAGATFYFIL